MYGAGASCKRSSMCISERDPASAWSDGVAFVGDDRIAISPWASGDSHLSPVVARIFDLSSGAEVGVVKRPGGNTEAREIGVSPDGTLLAASHGEINPELDLYRLPGGELLDAVEAHTGGVLDIEFSRDGSVLATGGVDGAAKVWTTENGKLRERLALRSKPHPVMSVSFSGDATKLVTVGQISDEARVWDVTPAGRGEVLTLPGPESGPVPPAIAFTPDGRRLVASSGPAGTVRVWDAKTGDELLVLDGHARTKAPARGVSGIDVSPDGSRIATAGADGSARVYDAESGEQLLVVRGRHCLDERRCAVNRAVFSPDGTRIATTGSDATVRIMATDTGRELRVLRPPRPRRHGHVLGRVEHGRQAPALVRQERSARLGCRERKVARAHGGRARPGRRRRVEPRRHRDPDGGPRRRSCGTPRRGIRCAGSRPARRPRTSPSAATGRA